MIKNITPLSSRADCPACPSWTCPGATTPLAVLRPTAIWAPHAYFSSTYCSFPVVWKTFVKLMAVLQMSSIKLLRAWGVNAGLCHPARGPLPQLGQGHFQTRITAIHRQVQAEHGLKTY